MLQLIIQTADTIDVTMDEFVLDEKSSFKLLEMSLTSKLNWGSYIVSIAKTSSKEIGALIPFMEFFSSDITLCC